MYLITYYT